MEFKPKICQICGTEYVPYNSNQKYCGADCQKQGQRNRRIKHYNTLKRRTMEERIDRKIEIGLEKRMRHADPNISLNEVARMAAEAHMTYGEYVLKHNI